MKLLKKYWDIIGGALTGILLAVVAKFELIIIQLYYSIIILILVSIGVFKIIKQAIENQLKKKPRDRKHNIVDDMVDAQKPVKAISLATQPLKEGEKLGKLILITMRGAKRTMKKIKELFDKFKGYLLTIALGILTVIEMCGGYINDLMGDALTINGVEILPIITLACTIVVGLVSNGFTKEQREKIKTLLTKPTSNEFVKTELRKQIKENETKLKELNKILIAKETELATLEAQLEGAKNIHEAKQELLKMVPPLATAADVQLAANEVVNIEARIVEKKQEIANTQKSVDDTTTTINAAKNSLAVY